MYNDHTSYSPKNDAPRAVAVYTNSLTGGWFHAGVGRPRKLYVLYPWKGKTLLCEGAVMPYYEFVTKSGLTDEEWKKRLDSEERPSIPKWMFPAVSGGRLGKPDFRKID